MHQCDFFFTSGLGMGTRPRDSRGIIGLRTFCMMRSGCGSSAIFFLLIRIIFFFLSASATLPPTVVPEPTGETWLQTWVAVETLLFVVWKYTWMENWKKPANRVFRLKNLQSLNPLTAKLQPSSLKKKILKSTLKEEGTSYEHSKATYLNSPATRFSIAFFYRRGPEFVPKCCSIRNEKSSSSQERYTVSNKELMQNCYNNAPPSTIIALAVLVAILTLALFICCANLFWYEMSIQHFFFLAKSSTFHFSSLVALAWNRVFRREIEEKGK